MTRWIAVIFMAFVTGAATVLLADPGTTVRLVPTSAVAGLGHDHSASEADVASGLAALENGHQHGKGDVKLDNATQSALGVQLAQTTRLIEKYPNVAAAEAGGYHRAGRFNPGLGVHYVGGQGDGMIRGVNGEAMVPELIYASTEPDAPIVGFMFQANGIGGDVPEGFIGPNDHWHNHTDLCIKFTPDGIRTASPDKGEVTKAFCDKESGQFIAQTGYMLHVWTVPGYESSLGVFSGVNPKMTCPDGTYLTAKPNEATDTSICKNP